MRGKFIALITIAATVALIVMIQSTDPSSIGPVGLLAVFFLIYVIIVGCFTELIYIGSGGLAWVSQRIPGRRPMKCLSVRRAWYFASLYALAPVIFLAMQSIGTLGLYEVALVLFFMVIGTVYLSNRAPR